VPIIPATHKVGPFCWKLVYKDQVYGLSFSKLAVPVKHSAHQSFRLMQRQLEGCPQEQAGLDPTYE
jgi:hypothetical protein